MNAMKFIPVVQIQENKLLWNGGFVKRIQNREYFNILQKQKIKRNIRDATFPNLLTRNAITHHVHQHHHFISCWHACHIKNFDELSVIKYTSGISRSESINV